MSNWVPLLPEEYKKAWDFVYDTLHFKPHNDSQPLLSPSFKLKCFDISSYYNENFNEEVYSNLHESTIGWLKQINPYSRFFALNWQHECYSFDINKPFEKNEFNEWYISPFPNGDYHFFLASDFKNGFFSDGLNFHICFFGEEMINSISKIHATILSKEI